MAKKKVRSVFKAPTGKGVGPSSWTTSVGKAKMVWRNPRKKPRSRARKGW